MKKLILSAFAFACALLLISAADAATVTFHLYTPAVAGAGTFRVTVESSLGDNFGVASYGIQLIGNPAVGPGGNILTVNHNSLRGFDVETVSPGGDPGAAGFTLLRSADDTNASVGSAAITISGSQDTIDSSAHLIDGFGQYPSTSVANGLVGFIPEGGGWGNAGINYPGRFPPAHAGEFEIARGTMAPNSSTPILRFGIDFRPIPTAITGANVFTSPDLSSTAPATIVRIIHPPFPEPSSLALAALGALAGVACRHRGSARR